MFGLEWNDMSFRMSRRAAAAENRAVTPHLKEQRRDQILAGATHVFAQKGYGSTQIADIAQHLGIGHGTVYRYFEDKVDVFRGVLTRAIERVGGALLDDAPGAETLEAYEAQVGRIAHRLYEAVGREEDAAKLIFEEAFAVREIAGEVEAALDAFAAMTAAYLVHGQARGFLRSDLDPEIAARAINAMIFEGARRILRSDDRAAALERWARDIRTLFIRGIQKEK
jgi:AcrR family transcriptional regulator